MIGSCSSNKFLRLVLVTIATTNNAAYGFSPAYHHRLQADGTVLRSSSSNDNDASTRRGFLGGVTGTAAAAIVGGLSFGGGVASPPAANAVGPVKVDIVNPVIIGAVPCPPSKPIPGEKAMQGMRAMCVTVKADYKEPVPKSLEKVGIYGYVTAGDTGESVLANNPDGGTDAGQFTMIESVKENDKEIEFEFIAAVVMNKDLRQYENGIGPLDFKSLRIISYPGGQQYGGISPCEMNEFSDECDAWEAENGPFKRGDYMVKSNPRTKSR